MKWHKLFFLSLSIFSHFEQSEEFHLFRHSEPALFAGVESHLFESFYKNWEVKGEENKSNNQNQ